MNSFDYLLDQNRYLVCPAPDETTSARPLTTQLETGLRTGVDACTGAWCKLRDKAQYATQQGVPNVLATAQQNVQYRFAKISTALLTFFPLLLPVVANTIAHTTIAACVTLFFQLGAAWIHFLSDNNGNWSQRLTGLNMLVIVALSCLQVSTPGAFYLIPWLSAVLLSCGDIFGPERFNHRRFVAEQASMLDQQEDNTTTIRDDHVSKNKAEQETVEYIKMSHHRPTAITTSSSSSQRHVHLPRHNMVMNQNNNNIAQNDSCPTAAMRSGLTHYGITQPLRVMLYLIPLLLYNSLSYSHSLFKPVPIRNIGTPIGQVSYPSIFSWLFASNHSYWLNAWHYKYMSWPSIIGGALFFTNFVLLMWCHWTKMQFAQSLQDSAAPTASLTTNTPHRKQKLADAAAFDHDDEKNDKEITHRPITRSIAHHIARHGGGDDDMNNHDNDIQTNHTVRHNRKTDLEQRVLAVSPFVRHGPFKYVQFPEIMLSIFMHLGYFLSLAYPYEFRAQQTGLFSGAWAVSPLNKLTGLTLNMDRLYLCITAICILCSCIASCREAFASHRSYFRIKKNVLDLSNVFVRYQRETPRYIPGVV